ncbi:hypothetical protein PR202_ga21548 [Eleusine coracana subsp. coracana]|uniref:BTB domain-containing protein n=1 Tax=Eleusine coracana subsp. coracana TaxID=191504 RepID=A0AAV5D150_ELECO|nr:hypothetical protein PR202_ga21548 [Eleusine coracana subsp. coracana]
MAPAKAAAAAPEVGSLTTWPSSDALRLGAGQGQQQQKPSPARPETGALNLPGDPGQGDACSAFEARRRRPASAPASNEPAPSGPVAVRSFDHIRGVRAAEPAPSSGCIRSDPAPVDRGKECLRRHRRAGAWRPDRGVGRLGDLLDHNVGTDALFRVDDAIIAAHRVVLAARSPVFKAEVFGSTADATSQAITVKDIEPSVFTALLEFMYTDEIPQGEELGDCPTETMQQILAAADRHQVDRLKLMSARWLWDNISVDTFAYHSLCRDVQLPCAQGKVHRLLCFGEIF